MKRIAILVCSLALVLGMTASASTKKPVKKVVYVTSLDCEHCAKKIRENVSFEKGVKDLSVDVARKTVEIKFDGAKTDTLKLRKAINKLGYEASVVSFE